MPGLNGVGEMDILNSTNEIAKFFPKLLKDTYSLTSPKTTEYNCIAWAAGENEQWWWPDSNDICYWPSEIPRVETLEAFINAFEKLGYSVCDNEKFENSFEKVAIYAINKKPTHAARQLPSGRWTSKLGCLEDIEHMTLDDLNGDKYGSVTLILKRHL